MAAVRHTWADLEPYLDPGPERAMFAHERVVRGEDLTGADVDTAVLEMPLALCEWEPGYPLAEYGSDRVDAPTPAVPGLTESPTRKAPRVDEPFTIDALAALVAPWVEQSNGRADVVAVKGDASAAIGTLGAVQAYLAPVDTRSAFSWMAWAAASGGAHGRRSGMAAGRFGAWWAGAALAGVEWPPDPAELGVGVDELDWWLWSDGAATGWSLRLAVEDTGSGLAWAIGAVDEE